MSTFQKGNQYGHGRGNSPNKLTTKVRNMIADIVADNMEQFKQDLLCLEPKERCDVIIKLMKYVAPTLTSVQFDASTQADNATEHLHSIASWGNKENTQLST